MAKKKDEAAVEQPAPEKLGEADQPGPDAAQPEPSPAQKAKKEKSTPTEESLKAKVVKAADAEAKEAGPLAEQLTDAAKRAARKKDNAEEATRLAEEAAAAAQRAASLAKLTEDDVRAIRVTEEGDLIAVTSRGHKLRVVDGRCEVLTGPGFLSEPSAGLEVEA